MEALTRSPAGVAWNWYGTAGQASAASTRLEDLFNLQDPAHSTRV